MLIGTQGVASARAAQAQKERRGLRATKRFQEEFFRAKSIAEQTIVRHGARFVAIRPVGQYTPIRGDELTVLAPRSRRYPKQSWRYVKVRAEGEGRLLYNLPSIEAGGRMARYLTSQPYAQAVQIEQFTKQAWRCDWRIGYDMVSFPPDRAFGDITSVFSEVIESFFGPARDEVPLRIEVCNARIVELILKDVTPNERAYTLGNVRDSGDVCSYENRQKRDQIGGIPLWSRILGPSELISKLFSTKVKQTSPDLGFDALRKLLSGPNMLDILGQLDILKKVYTYFSALKPLDLRLELLIERLRNTQERFGGLQFLIRTDGDLDNRPLAFGGQYLDSKQSEPDPVVKMFGIVIFPEVMANIMLNLLGLDSEDIKEAKRWGVWR